MGEDEVSKSVETDELQACLRTRLESMVDELQATLWIRRYIDHMERLRSLPRPSEKLVYLFLVLSQPQSFTTIRRSLSLSSSTVDRAVKRLLERGYLVLDETCLYWVNPPRFENNT
jgi:biotin operon repressor